MELQDMQMKVISEPSLPVVTSEFFMLLLRFLTVSLRHQCQEHQIFLMH